MPSHATARRLSTDDVQDYRRIRLSGLQTAPYAFGSTYDAEAARPDEHFAERLTTSLVFGAYADGRIVGVLGCKRFDGARETHKAFLWGFYVEPECRGSGVGRALLDASLGAARATVEQVLLTVVADNWPAIALYERCGFRPYGLEPRALRSPGGYADELLMVLFLPGFTDERRPASA